MTWAEPLRHTWRASVAVVQASGSDMEPDEVKRKWPVAWRVAVGALAKDDSRTMPVIKAVRDATGLGLAEAKRVLHAVRYGESLESHQERLFEGLRQALDQIEAEDEDD